MNPDADLSPYGIAATIASFLEALDLEDVTIVGNDSGGAMSQVLVTRHPERIGRLVLTNCDTHENFPPGLFKTMPPLAKLPGGMALLAAPFRIGAVARAAFKPFTKDPDPARADRLLDGAGPARPRRQARPQEGDDRDEQALHAGGGGEAAQLRPAHPAHLGARRPPLPASSTRSGSPPNVPTRASSRSPTRGPSSRSTSPQRLADEIAAFVARCTLRDLDSRSAQAAPILFRSLHVFRLTGGDILRRNVPPPSKDGEPCPRRSSTRIGPGARWRGASTKPSPAATSGPSPHPPRRSEIDLPPGCPAPQEQPTSLRPATACPARRR